MCQHTNMSKGFLRSQVIYLSTHIPYLDSSLFIVNLRIRRTAQKCISLSFLGLVDTLHKVAKLWGLYRLSNKILGGLYP